MQLVSIPSNPVPEGAVTGMLKTPDGTALRFARWLPPAGRKGTLCIFPGRAEFIEKYFEVVRDAQQRGFAVASLDWRGQGLSQRLLRDGRKGHVGDFSQYDLDLDTFIKEIVLPDCPPPLFALAHSMGATVLIRAAHRGRRFFERIVLSAPMVALVGRAGSRPARVGARALRLAGMGHSYLPTGGATAVQSKPFVGNILTSDPVRYERTAAIVEAEPTLAVGSPTIGWVDAAYRTMRSFAAPNYAEQLRQPILMVAAGQDQLISTPKIGEFATRLPVGSHLVIAGARHEILMEADRYRSQFWAAFDAFVPGTPAFK
jgi:lysophospholipase